ncbi:S41 family peptidase [Proteinivorax hydrogeniformans]|uniref:S41 family peptidase n=1 Tax=Proteinivorax hydrogeniformans TaxID=1826727 RepID=A0AAU8HSS7_9FIRM
MIKLNHSLILFLCTITIILFTGCESNEVQQQVEIPEEIKELVAENRSFAPVDDEKELIDEFNKLLYEYEDFGEEPDDKFVEIDERVTFITAEEAIADVEYFFGILKYGYAAYEYFGGDDKFLNAKENIIDEINQKEEKLYNRELEMILEQNLDFIQDGHFRIGMRQLYQEYIYYSSDEFSFLKDDNGFYTLIDNNKYYLTDIDDGDIEDYIKLSINEEGELVYFLGGLYPSTRLEQHIDITLQSEDDKTTETVSLQKVSASENVGEEIYTYGEVDSIPIIGIRAMHWQTNREEELLANFTEDAKKLKNEDHFIIDVRGNTGGYVIYPIEWIENYTGEKVQRSTVSSTLFTNTTTDAIKRGGVRDIEEIRLQDYYPGWAPTYYSNPQLRKNSTPIFVITDKNTGSSGESFIDYLAKLDNVIFIGTNTAGVSLVGNNHNYILPNSLTRVQFGQTLILNPDLSDSEGVGFKPDFWVAPDKAIESISKFINNYL